MIKTICFFFFFLFFWLHSLAQNDEKQSQATDFVLTDTQGHLYHLYDELSAGKTVVLDFFSVSCGSCATSVPVLDQIWQNNGGTANDLWVWGIEVFQATNSQIDAFSSDNGGTYPCFSADENDSLMLQYEIQYTPRFYVICPDKRRIPSLLGDIQFNIDQCRLSSSNNFSKEHNSAIVFMSDKEMLYFSFTENVSGWFEIVDIYGRIILVTATASDNNFSFKISKSKFSSGIYLYHFTDKNNKSIQGKFMVL